jgi:two-component system chemotaxis sensor kinase CheA
VVVDINMPRLNGLELARRIRAHPELRDTPVYVLTTSDAGPDRTGAFQLGVSGYLLKSELPAGLGRIFQAARPAA